MLKHLLISAAILGAPLLAQAETREHIPVPALNQDICISAMADFPTDDAVARYQFFRLASETAYGATPTQRLFGVQIPLAMPTIMAGINQTIMMALAMVVVASMIGVKGLGQPVLKSITNQYFTLGLLNGLAIVALAIIFDRVSQSYAKRAQKHLEGTENG